MLVKMKTHFSGTRDMQEWPPVGGIIDLPAREAERMIGAGHAEEATNADLETERKSQAAEDSDSTAGATERDEPTAGDSDNEATAGGDGPAGTVDGDATKPISRRARKAPAKKAAAKKRTPRKRR